MPRKSGDCRGTILKRSVRSLQWGALLVAMMLPLPALAQETTGRLAAETAMRAADDLRAARETLSLASRAEDRITALSETVRAYETGLSALRSGLRQVTIQERALSSAFETRRTQIASLLGVLTTMERAPAPLLLLHPTGPLGTARSGQMIADLTPALQAEADALKFDLETLQLLRGLQETAATDLEAGLSGVQVARAQLASAMSQRIDLPRRFVSDPVAMGALVEGAETLTAFATGLSDLPEASLAPVEGPTVGTLDLPVAGRILRRFQETDAAGIRRPGWIVATQPASLVTSPVDATIRYAGPLLDYGKVIVLEPAQGSLLILAGLREIYGTTGEIITQSAPVGLMGGALPSADDFLTETREGGGTQASESLYIEVREAGAPVDPATWFAGP